MSFELRLENCSWHYLTPPSIGLTRCFSVSCLWQLFLMRLSIPQFESKTALPSRPPFHYPPARDRSHYRYRESLFLPLCVVYIPLFWYIQFYAVPARGFGPSLRVSVFLAGFQPSACGDRYRKISSRQKYYQKPRPLFPCSGTDTYPMSCPFCRFALFLLDMRSFTSSYTLGFLASPVEF